MSKKLGQQIVASVFAFAGLVGTVSAKSYSDLVFFGDSLSDTGNVLSLTTAFAPPPFPAFPGAEGRFSNGPVWTEYLAGDLGFPDSAKPSNLLFLGGTTVIPIGIPGGQNFSYGGARTGYGGSAGPTTGLLSQLATWALTSPAPDPNALYVLTIGANDLRDARTANPDPLSAADSAARSAAAATIAGNVTSAVAYLAQAGVRHFLVSNAPDLGVTPEAAFLGVQAASTDVSVKFNQDLAADLTNLDASFLAATGIDLDIMNLDFFGLTDAIYNDAINNHGMTYGITNVVAPCILPGPGGEYFAPDSTDINCSVSASSDGLHPANPMERLLGNLAFSSVPEPGSLALVLLGGGVLSAGLRRRLSANPARAL